MRKSKGIFRVQAGLLIGLLMVSLIPVEAVGAAATTPPRTETESILISPVSKRYSIEAGEARNDSLEVVNDGQNEYLFTMYARPYSVSNEDYEPDFTSKNQNADVYRWVQFEQSSFTIKPGETKIVKYTIRVPSSATPGGHYGVIFAETQPDDIASGIAVKRKKRIGSIIYATVKGDISLSGSLKSTSVPFFQSIPPLTSARRIENSGNTDFVVTSNMKVMDAFGSEKFKSVAEHTVLPQTTRNIVSEWPNASWLGFYKVELNTKYLDTNKTTTNYVLMVPLWVYLTLGLLIGVRILYALARRKRS